MKKHVEIVVSLFFLLLATATVVSTFTTLGFIVFNSVYFLMYGAHYLTDPVIQCSFGGVITVSFFLATVLSALLYDFVKDYH
jgi:hypothetical protein